MRNLIIRADADPEIGSGHVMRCLALAQAWCDAGGAATFVSAAMPLPLQERLRGEGVSVVTIPGKIGTDADASATVRLARDREASWVVIDGYHFEAAYRAQIADAGYQLLWVDDMGRAGPDRADIVLNQNLHACEALYVGRAATTRLLLGTDYVLLRREFLPWRERERNSVTRACRVLVTMGGADPRNTTCDVVRALAQLTLEDLEAVVVVGADYPHGEALEDVIDGSPRFRIENNVTKMSELMAWADVAIAAGGTTSWELAFSGLPAILVALADNQRDVANAMHAAGAAISLGWYAQLSHSTLAETVSMLLLEPGRRAEMTRRGRILVDGKGASRVLKQMLDSTLTLRRASEADCKLLWDLANDPMVRRSSFSTESIPWETHVRWFHDRLASSACYMYVAMEGMAPVGQIRYDVSGDVATVSVSLKAEHRGRAHGVRVIRLGTRTLFRSTGVERIVAFVKEDNPASVLAFERAGFHLAERTVVDGVAAQRLTIAKTEVTDE